MWMPRRRLRWPNVVNEHRLEALANAAQSSKQAIRAKELLNQVVHQRYHLNNPEAVELILTKIALLLAEIEANQERIQRLLIDAAHGEEKTPES